MQLPPEEQNLGGQHPVSAPLIVSCPSGIPCEWNLVTNNGTDTQGCPAVAASLPVLPTVPQVLSEPRATLRSLDTALTDG